jgi:hypothetical protein
MELLITIFGRSKITHDSMAQRLRPEWLNPTIAGDWQIRPNPQVNVDVHQANVNIFNTSVRGLATRMINDAIPGLAARGAVALNNALRIRDDSALSLDARGPHRCRATHTQQNVKMYLNIASFTIFDLSLLIPVPTASVEDGQTHHLLHVRPKVKILKHEPD